MIATNTMQTEVAPPAVRDTDAEIKLDARHINFWYGDFQALHDASLAVQARKITALIGPSGCGKTTFLRIFNRMHDLVPGTKATGAVLLDGHNVLSPDTDVINLRRQVGMLFQRANPFPKSIYDNVSYGPHILGWSKEQTSQIVEESLKDTGLWDEVKDRLRRSALNLSGGQQQRLCVARALATDPELLLLDEPTSALDHGARDAIEAALAELRRELEIAVVLVTHDPEQARRLSDWVVRLEAGRVAGCGALEEVLV
jgi:phosphate transport system ATP-binding protein